MLSIQKFLALKAENSPPAFFSEMKLSLQRDTFEAPCVANCFCSKILRKARLEEEGNNTKTLPLFLLTSQNPELMMPPAN